MAKTPAKDDQHVADRREANTCIALGASVGALGAVGAAISGAVCPACLIVAPGLLGVGIVRRLRASKQATERGTGGPDPSKDSDKSYR